MDRTSIGRIPVCGTRCPVAQPGMGEGAKGTEASHPADAAGREARCLRHPYRQPGIVIPATPHVLAFRLGTTVRGGTVP
jgi:hypothetical protein